MKRFFMINTVEHSIVTITTLFYQTNIGIEIDQFSRSNCNTKYGTRNYDI
jgi:hypothetical protein